MVATRETSLFWFRSVLRGRSRACRAMRWGRCRHRVQILLLAAWLCLLDRTRAARVFAFANAPGPLPMSGGGPWLVRQYHTRPPIPARLTIGAKRNGCRVRAAGEGTDRGGRWRHHSPRGDGSRGTQGGRGSVKRRGASLPVEHGRARHAEKSSRGSTALALQWAGTAEEIIAICDSTNGRRFLRHPHLGLNFFPQSCSVCARMHSRAQRTRRMRYQ